MPPKHSRDEQPREGWPLNEERDRPDEARLASRPDTGRHARPTRGAAAAGSTGAQAGGRTAVAVPADGQAPASPGGREAPTDGGGAAAPARDDTARAPAGLGDVDFASYVRESLKERQEAPVRARPDERASFERVGLGTLYRSGEVRTDDRYDDNVLGLNYSTVAPRAPVGDEGWAWSLRGFARAATWLLPAGVGLLALSSVFGAPTDTRESALVSPGTWVMVTALGLGLWLLGVVALAALGAVNRVRPWGIVAVVTSALGVALIAPVVGVTGLARPVIARTARTVDDPAIADPAARMQQGLLDNSAGRWLLVGGGVLLGVGALAVVVTILGSRVLQRHDGWLMLAGVAIAVIAAYLSWEFLFTLAAMVMLAGALGLAYTVSRLAPDGTAPPAY